MKKHIGEAGAYGMLDAETTSNQLKASKAKKQLQPDFD